MNVVRLRVAHAADDERSRSLAVHDLNGTNKRREKRVGGVESNGAERARAAHLYLGKHAVGMIVGVRAEDGLLARQSGLLVCLGGRRARREAVALGLVGGLEVFGVEKGRALLGFVAHAVHLTRLVHDFNGWYRPRARHDFNDSARVLVDSRTGLWKPILGKEIETTIAMSS